MPKSPTCVNHGWLNGGGQTRKQNRRQRRKHSQWHSWMQYRCSRSRSTIAANVLTSPAPTAALSFSSSAGFCPSSWVTLAKAYDSLSGSSIATTGKMRQSWRQTSTQRQLQKKKQM